MLSILSRLRAFNEVDIIENPKQKLSFLSFGLPAAAIHNQFWILSCVANYKSVSFVVIVIVVVG